MAFNEITRAVLHASQAAGVRLLRCDRMMSISDSGFVNSRLRVLEETQPSLLAVHLFKLPSSTPGQPQRRAARGPEAFCCAPMQGGSLLSRVRTA